MRYILKRFFNVNALVLGVFLMCVMAIIDIPLFYIIGRRLHLEERVENFFGDIFYE